MNAGPRLRWRLPFAGLLAAALLALAFPGCLDGIQALDGCDADLVVDDVARAAPNVGGPGPRAVTVLVADPFGMPIAGAAVVAWWELELSQAEAAGLDGPIVQVVRLRSGPDGKALANVPTGQDIHLLGGVDSWTNEGLAAAGSEPVSVDLIGALQAGSVEGSWDMPAAVGVQTRSWDPQEMPWADADHLARLQSLVLILDWTNMPQGSADFGIAVGGDELDRYWNQEYQTSFGSYQETLTLSLTDLEEYGWTGGDSLRAGPSISTGAYSVTPIEYQLTWAAEFKVESDPGLLCDRLGEGTLVEDVTSPASTGPAASASARPSMTASTTPRPSAGRLLG